MAARTSEIRHGPRREQANGPPHDYRPVGAATGTGLFATLKRTVAEFREHNLGDWAAALTYYALLSLFPALIALVAIVGLFGDPRTTTSTITDIVTSIGPDSAAQTFQGPIESITSNRSGAGIALVIALVTALWSGSGYVGAFIRASNVIYETPEGRSFWKLRPLQLLLTLAMVVLMAIVALGLVLTGPIVDDVAGPIGLSSTATTIWSFAKWPALAGLFTLIIAVLYYASPNVRVRGFKWVTPGSILALVAWVVASAAFAFYVANFGSYNETYGALGGLVVLLIWFWITNVAILFGHQLNAEIERSLELREGKLGAERQIQLEPRSNPDQGTS
jgi:membrane protein